MGQCIFSRLRAGAYGTSTSTRCVGISSKTLSVISGKLGDEWKELAIELGFDEANIREFEVNNPGNVRHQKFQMLTQWKRGLRSIEGQMDVLCNALEEIGRCDIVLHLQKFPEVPIKMDVPKDCKDIDTITKFLIAMEKVLQTHGPGCLQQQVAAFFEEKGMDLVQVTSGSVTLVVRIMSREDLNKLWSMYTTGELAKKLTEILITDELTTADESDLAFQATILESDYDQACRFFDKLEKEQGKVVIEDSILSDISEKLGEEWRKLAHLFGFDDAKLREFENSGNVRYQKFRMLTEWRRGRPSPEGQMAELCNALEMIDRKDIVVWLHGQTVTPGPGATPMDHD